MDDLRLTLLVCGVLLVGGIYVWETVKRRKARRRHLMDEPDEGLAEELDDFPHGFFVNPSNETDHSGASRELKTEGMMEVGDLESITAYDQDEDIGHVESVSVDDTPPVLRMPHARGNAADELIVALTLIAPPGERFLGEDIRSSLESVGMRYGDMKIFHHFGTEHEPLGNPIFSAANIVEPGTFEIDEFDSCATPGLAFFLRLPGEMEGDSAFELMLSTCQQLAKLLGGELRDETRSSLTSQSIGHIRERISEFRREQLVKTLQHS